MNDKW